jgi:hypothetical protein
VAALDPAALPTRSFCEDTVSPSFVEPMQAWIAVGAEQNAIRPRTRQGLAQQAAALAAQSQMALSSNAATDIRFCGVDDPTCEACQ